MEFTAVFLLLLMTSSASQACDLMSQFSLNEETNYDSSLPDSSTECYPRVNNIDYGTQHFFKYDLFPQEENTGSYWSDWGEQSDDSEPFVTQKLAQSYIGLGVWMPPELVEKQAEMTADEWVRNHGLLLSFGFGDKDSGEPRMRMDYRWHEDYEADLMILIEVPF